MEEQDFAMLQAEVEIPPLYRPRFGGKHKKQMTILEIHMGTDGVLRGFVYDDNELHYLALNGNQRHGYESWFVYMAGVIR